MKRSHSLKTKPSITQNLRRSKTFREIKANGIQNGNNGVSYGYCMTLENDKKIDSLPFTMQQMNLRSDVKTTNNEQRLEPTGSVVFVLGDNEVLSGLKTPPPSPVLNNKINEKCSIGSSPSVSDEQCQQSSNASSSHGNLSECHSTNVTAPHMLPSTANNGKQEKKKKHCTHKKHSGVKFNFEQYPQIVTNYMKNKNLDITSYDFLEKGLKLEQENTFNFGASSTSFLPRISAPEDIQEQDDEAEEEQCECCANTFRILQTPSNATELELDDPVPIAKPTSKKLDTLVENDNVSNSSYSCTSQTSEIEDKKNDADKIENEIKCKKDSVGSIKRMNHLKCLEFITLPIPKTEILNNNRRHHRIRQPGYVPSLFVGITDHFIPDMVLQGITAPPPKWEPILRQNLTLTSHCATFEQIPTENVAIIANIDKW